MSPGLQFLGEILPPFEVVESVLAHFCRVGDSQITIVVNHIGVDIVLRYHPGAAFDRGWLFGGIATRSRIFWELKSLRSVRFVV